jgi:hypothetical protein
MHPNLRNASRALPSAEFPEPISDNVEACLTLQVATLTSTSKLLQAFDAVSDARAEVVGMRLYVASLIPQLQAEIRKVEKRLTAENPTVKPTPLDRLLKTNPDFFNAEMEIGKLNALKDYCDAVEGLLDSKAFNLRMLLKDRNA